MVQCAALMISIYNNVENQTCEFVVQANPVVSAHFYRIPIMYSSLICSVKTLIASARFFLWLSPNSYSIVWPGSQQETRFEILRRLYSRRLLVRRLHHNTNSTVRDRNKCALLEIPCSQERNGT